MLYQCRFIIALVKDHIQREKDALGVECLEYRYEMEIFLVVFLRCTWGLLQFIMDLLGVAQALVILLPLNQNLEFVSEPPLLHKAVEPWGEEFQEGEFSQKDGIDGNSPFFQ